MEIDVVHAVVEIDVWADRVTGGEVAGCALLCRERTLVLGQLSFFVGDESPSVARA